jgi:hypothetical protein
MLRDRFFAGREDQIDIAQISPRVFEAIALRTLIIAYPGRYSGVLEPWRHYVPLDKDHGNMAQVAAVLRDPERVAEIITNAYAEIALNPAYSYGAMIEVFDERIAEAAAGRPRARPRPRRRQVPQGLPVHRDRQSPRYAPRGLCWRLARGDVRRLGSKAWRAACCGGDVRKRLVDADPSPQQRQARDGAQPAPQHRGPSAGATPR